jgi:hypothetical protein
MLFRRSLYFSASGDFESDFVDSAPNGFQTGCRAGSGSLYKRPERDSEQFAVSRNHHSDTCSFGLRVEQTLNVSATT